MASDAPAAVGDPDARFRQLPSVKLFTDQIELVRQELVVRWDGYGGTDEYPFLWQLWTTAKAQAKHTLREFHDDPHATEFLASWAALDELRGDPLARGWVMTTREAAERFDVLTDYLHAAGELNVQHVRPDAPEEYLSEEERDGA